MTTIEIVKEYLVKNGFIGLKIDGETQNGQNSLIDTDDTMR